MRLLLAFNEGEEPTARIRGGTMIAAEAVLCAPNTRAQQHPAPSKPGGCRTQRWVRRVLLVSPTSSSPASLASFLTKCSFATTAHCSLSMNKGPPPADANLVAQLACVGPIALCLSEALDDLVSECLVEQIQQEAGEKSDSEEKAETVKVAFDSIMADCVMHSFGQAVAKSQWEAPPAALLRGKVEHYNNLEGKWRIVVKNAEIRQRVPLAQTNPRKKQKVALWDASELRQGEHQPVTALAGSLQILAYGDL